ncbi:hypothetical protein [Saccharothrix sp. ST-888]|uniref:hypothetical protein n=1 Tax=Saccharothrix sp. ST-888 TaxID=1427391 RepID=UPI000697E5F9|nr:hypothetical protein [Saccharothrix sp. ST-888]
MKAQEGDSDQQGLRHEEQENRPRPAGAAFLGAVEEVDQALLQARSLIDSMESYRRRSGSPGRLLVIEDQTTLEEAVGNLLVGTVRHVSAVVPGGGSEAEILGAVLACTKQVAAEAAAVRLLFSPRAIRQERAREAARRIPRCEVRVFDSALPEAVVVDTGVALVWSDLGAGGRRVSLVRDAAVVGALTSLFAVAWANASRTAARPAPGGRVRTEVGRRILEALRAGQTDEVAARELGVPLRTYRRHVADIMREIGASSRFQAGARAVELGLLTDGE